MFDKVISYAKKYPKVGYFALMCIPDFPVWIQVNGIGKFRIRVRRNRSFWLRNPLCNERYSMSAISHFASIEKECTLYDIGANIGLHTRFAIQCFGVDEVIAFEPMKENISQLEKNIWIKKLGSVVNIMPYAISDDNGKAKLQVDDFQSATASLNRVTGGEPAEGRADIGLGSKTETVETRKLDALLSKKDLSPPDILKIDVEGAESLVLDGAREVLSAYQPHLVVETHGATHAREVLSFLIAEGYSTAASVEGNLQRENERYRHLGADDVSLIQGKYDARFIFASPDPDCLPSELSPYFVP